MTDFEQNIPSLPEISWQLIRALDNLNSVNRLQTVLKIAQEQLDKDRIQLLLDCYIEEADYLFEECQKGFTQVQQDLENLEETMQDSHSSDNSTSVLFPLFLCSIAINVLQHAWNGNVLAQLQVAESATAAENYPTSN